MLKQLVKRRIKKTGGSLCITFPKEVLEDTGWTEGTALFCAVLEVKEGKPVMLLTGSPERALRYAGKLKKVLDVPLPAVVLEDKGKSKSKAPGAVQGSRQV